MREPATRHEATRKEVIGIAARLDAVKADSRLSVMIWLYALVLLTAAAPVIASPSDEVAKREHFFPLLIDGDGFRSYLFLTDAENAADRCALELRGPGLNADHFETHANLSIAGAGATIGFDEPGASLTLATSGEGALTFGYAKLDCDGPVVARMLMSLKVADSLISTTTMESARAGNVFQFPVLPRLGRLAVVVSNDSGLAASCALELRSASGVGIGGSSITALPRATALEFLGDLITIPESLEAGKVTISCDRPVATVGLPLDGSVFTALNAIDLEFVAAKSFHILPLILDGDGFRSRLLITNLSETDNLCMIEFRGEGLDANRFYSPAGSTVTGSRVFLELTGKGDQEFLHSLGEQTLVFGYAMVECEENAAAQNVLTAGTMDTIHGMATIPSAQEAIEMRIPVVPELDRMSIAINRVSETDAECAVELWADGEAISGSGPIWIPGASTTVRFLGDLLAVPSNFTGFANLNCNEEVAAISLPLSGAIFASMLPTVLSTRAESLLQSDWDGDGISDFEDALPKDPKRYIADNGVSTTLDDQIVMELRDDDTAPPNLFDLNGKTLLFRPAGEFGYERSVEPLAWEHETGEVVGEGDTAFGSFAFPFGGKEWDAFHANTNGTISFGEPLNAPHRTERFRELHSRGSAFTLGLPTIAVMYKPFAEGSKHVNQLADRVVLTWMASEFNPGVSRQDAVSPSSPLNAEFQAVLFADGAIAFNYRDVSYRDGIVGIFTAAIPEPRNRLLTLTDEEDDELPGYLDLRKVTVSDTASNSLIIEFTTQGEIPDVGEPFDEILYYHLYLDVDDPLISRIDYQDTDICLRVERWTDGRFTASQTLGEGMPPSRVIKVAPDRIRLLIENPAFEGGTVAGFAHAGQVLDDRFVRGDHSGTATFEMPTLETRIFDLSINGLQQSTTFETFHFRGFPDPIEAACRLIQALGDNFDFVVFASEFRMDQQFPFWPMARFGSIAEGIGRTSNNANHKCSDGKLKGMVLRPFDMNSDLGRGAGPPGYSPTGFHFALSVIGHEIGHLWTAQAVHEVEGRQVELYNSYSDPCHCHWRWELHSPVMFPWIEGRQASTMGGSYWEENPDGTFTLVANGFYTAAPGYSFLDLYLMGFLEANEVPDTFLVRDPVFLRQNTDGLRVYQGAKEVVTINQIIAALGSRQPATNVSQKEFNLAFVYLVEPGRAPNDLTLRRHAAMRDKFVEYWAHVTGQRSSITTNTYFEINADAANAPATTGNSTPRSTHRRIPHVRPPPHDHSIRH